MNNMQPPGNPELAKEHEEPRGSLAVLYKRALQNQLKYSFRIPNRK